MILKLSELSSYLGRTGPKVWVTQIHPELGCSLTINI